MDVDEEEDEESPILNSLHKLCLQKNNNNIIITIMYICKNLKYELYLVMKRGGGLMMMMMIKALRWDWNIGRRLRA